MSIIIDSKYVQLLSSRLEGFVKKKDRLWNFRCPVCLDSKTNKRKKRGYIYEKNGKLLFRCHNCDASMLFSNFLKQLDQNLWNQYRLETFGERNPKQKPTTAPKKELAREIHG